MSVAMRLGWSMASGVMSADASVYRRAVRSPKHHRVGRSAIVVGGRDRRLDARIDGRRLGCGVDA